VYVSFSSVKVQTDTSWALFLR